MIATESHIIHQIKVGNELVFEALSRSHYAALHAFARGFIADPEQAEEMVQDVFLRYGKSVIKLRSIPV